MQATKKDIFNKSIGWLKNKPKEIIFSNFSDPQNSYLQICDIFNDTITNGYIVLKEQDEIAINREVNKKEIEAEAYYLALKLSSSYRIIANLGNKSIDISSKTPIAINTSLLLYAESDSLNLFISVSSLVSNDVTNGIAYFIGLKSDSSFDMVKQTSINFLSLLTAATNQRNLTAEHEKPIIEEENILNDN